MNALNLLKMLFDLAKRLGLDPAAALRGLEVQIARPRMAAAFTARHFKSRARKEGMTPKLMSDSDDHKQALISWHLYWGCKGILSFSGTAADWLRDYLRAAVVAEVAPKVNATMKEAELFPLVTDSAMRHLPDPSQFLGQLGL
jgi:hypothetical protein